MRTRNGSAPDAKTALSVATVTKRCYDNLRPSGVKVFAGTLLLVPGFTEKDFDEIAALGPLLAAKSVEVLPVGLKELFLEKVKEDHANS